MKTTLEVLLDIIAVAATAAGPLLPNGTAQTVDAEIAALLRIAAKANAAHNAITGAPIDLSQLHDIDPVA